MSWQKMEPLVEGIHQGCLCCGGTHKIAPPDMCLAMGFGEATVTRNGKEVYSETSFERAGKDLWYLRDAEKVAAADPDNDWRIALIGPLREAYYQRQGENHWVLYKSGAGFA